MKGLKGKAIPLKPEYIIKKSIKAQKKTKIGNIVNVYDYELNMDFWKSIKEPISIVLDEFHNIANARTFMSKKNRVFNSWLTMIRRVLGSSQSGYGELVLISQLSNQVDLIARQLCHQVRYHICYYTKTCKKCGTTWDESSETPEVLHVCPSCGSPSLVKYEHRLKIWHFRNMDMFRAWKDFGMATYHRRYWVNDIEDYFGFYNTLQWDNLFEDY